MPELPDVEIFRRYFARTSLHKKITDVTIYEKSLLEKVSTNKLKKSLMGNKFDETKRHGKYLFAKVNNSWLVLHFGMTGFLKYYKNEKSKTDHVRLLISFSNNYSLAYDCQRKLGLIGLTNDLEKYIDTKKLGKDPYNKNFKLDDFRKIIESSRGSLKSFFMNQSHLAGIGNIYADEILFQSSIHPKTKVENIENDNIKTLFGKMTKILDRAIDVNVEIREFPRNYLIHYREDGKTCPKCKGKIKKIKINGRSTYFCSKHQKEVK